MTTEIYEAIFIDGVWGRTSKPRLMELENGEEIDQKGLEKLGMKISGLEKIVDNDDLTIIWAKKDKRLHFASLMDEFETINFELKSGFDIGVRKSGELRREMMGIQVLRV